MSGDGLAEGRYSLERTLGGGGMAVVHRARDHELHRSVAVKLLAEHLADDDELRARFLQEGRLAGRLSHPNVVAVYDAGEDGGRPYIVMELVEGETLAQALRRRGRLPAAEVAALGAQAAAGLAHAHARGLVHRDVKPQNLLIGADGTLKVADFGIARAAAATQRLTQVGTILGTAAYLAPEQAAGEDVTAAADVYALGVVLYEALTGRTPHDGHSLAELADAKRHGPVTAPGELVPGVPPGLEDVLMRCLARNPAFRPSIAEVERLLAGAQDAPTRPLRARRLPLPRPGRPLALPRRAVLALVAILAALGLAVWALAAATGGTTRPAAPPPDRPDRPAQQARDLADWLRAVAR